MQDSAVRIGEDFSVQSCHVSSAEQRCGSGVAMICTGMRLGRCLSLG